MSFNRGSTIKDGRLEVLRAAGALAVVLLHVLCSWAQNTDHYIAFYKTSAIRFAVDTLFHSVGTRWAVPVFLMISGALLINPEKEMPLKKLGRYIGRMLLVLLLFGMVCNVIELYFNSRIFSVSLFGDAFLNLIQGKSWDHLDYIFALVGLYILLPVFRGFVKNAEIKVLHFAALAMFLLMILVPSVNFYFHLSLTSFGIGTPSYLFYFFMGYLIYAEAKTPRFLKSKRTCGTLFLAGAAVFAAVNFYGILHDGKLITWNVSPEHIGVACMSVGLFGFVLKAKKSCELGNLKITGFLAKHSFCIYLVHPFFLHVLYRGLNFFPDALPPFVGELCVFAAVLLGSILASLLLHLIPGIRKLI